MKIIIGLGNPGREYAATRHNMGFRTIDALSEKYGIPVDENKCKGLVGRGLVGGERCMLVKPQTFMNNSGECVRAITDFYKVEIEDIIIIYDDIALEPGYIRVREKGSAGGHNGIKSIITHMNTQVFPRVRVGVGAKPEKWDLADHVLGTFKGDDVQAAEDGIKQAVEAVEMMVSGRISDAMTKFNSRKPSAKDPE